MWVYMLTLSGVQTDFFCYTEHHYKTNIWILRLGWCSQSPSFKDGSWYASIVTHFSSQNIIAYYIVCIRTIWKRSAGKYNSYWTMNKTTHFLSEFCEAGVLSSSAQRHRQARSQMGYWSRILCHGKHWLLPCSERLISGKGAHTLLCAASLGPNSILRSWVDCSHLAAS